MTETRSEHRDVRTLDPAEYREAKRDILRDIERDAVRRRNAADLAALLAKHETAAKDA